MTLTQIQIWLVLLIGRDTWKICFGQSQVLPNSGWHQYGISALLSQTSFHGKTSGGVTKCQLFTQAIISAALTYFLSVGPLSLLVNAHHHSLNY